MQLSNIFEIPVDLRQRALRIVNEIHAEARAYTTWKGQRLHHNRDIVSVPLMGDKYRLLFRFLHANDLTFCGACTHQVYDKIIQAKNTGSIKPMAPVLDDRLTALRPVTKFPTEPVVEKQLELQAQDAPEEPLAPSPESEAQAEPEARRTRRSGLTDDIEAWILEQAPGVQYTNGELMERFGGSATGVWRATETAVLKGVAKFIGGANTERKFERLPNPVSTTEKSAEALVAVITDALAQLRELCKPTRIEDFSDDDLAMETLRRMAARKAA